MKLITIIIEICVVAFVVVVNVVVITIIIIITTTTTTTIINNSSSSNIVFIMTISINIKVLYRKATHSTSLLLLLRTLKKG
jgi:hypothetical protein